MHVAGGHFYFYNTSACKRQQNNFCKNFFSLIKSVDKVCLSNAEALEFSSVYSKIGKKAKNRKGSVFGALSWQRYEQNLKTDISFENRVPWRIHLKEFLGKYSKIFSEILRPNLMLIGP